MAALGDSGLEPPISRAADGRVVYRPMLSVDAGFGTPIFDMQTVDVLAAPTIEVVLIDPEDFDQPVEVNDEDRAAAAPIDEAVAAVRSHFEPVAAWEGEGAAVISRRPAASQTSWTIAHTSRRSRIRNPATHAWPTRRWRFSRRCRTSRRPV